MKFSISITKTLVKIVNIEADSFNEALDKVIDAYKKEEIVLDDSDFITVEIG